MLSQLLVQIFKVNIISCLQFAMHGTDKVLVVNAKVKEWAILLMVSIILTVSDFINLGIFYDMNILCHS